MRGIASIAKAVTPEEGDQHRAVRQLRDLLGARRRDPHHGVRALQRGSAARDPRAGLLEQGIGQLGA
jgi:hypothetical protein